MFSIQKQLSKTDVLSGGNTKRFILVHHTASSPKTTFQQIINFLNQKDEKSVHFAVGRAGEIAQLADENDRAFHAGISEWNGIKNLNDHSVGIEILSDGITFTPEQTDATVWLIIYLMARFNIPAENVLRHADVAMPRGRKNDVGVNFYVPKWGSWKAFQQSLMPPTPYEIEKAEAMKWAIERKLSNGERPNDPVSREEFWVILKRFSDSK